MAHMLMLFLSLLILLFAFKLFLQTITRRKLHLPPSPPSLPFLGHLHLIKTPIHRTLYRLSQKYGQVFSLKFGSRLVVVVSSPSAIEECFTKNDIVLANRPSSFVGEHLVYNHTTVITSPFGDHWRNLRRIAALEIFSTNRLNMFSDIRKDEVKHLLWKLSRNSCQGFAKVELKAMFSDLTFNVIMRMVAGKRYFGEDLKDEEEAGKFRRLLKETVAFGVVSNPAEFVPVLRWIDNGGMEKKVKEISKRMDAFLQGLIDNQRSKDEEENTMIDHMLSLQKSHPEYYSDQIIKGFILVLLLVGTDISEVTLEWAMANLLNHSNVLKKARVEMDHQIGQEKLMDESDISELHYLQSVISETLRLYPSAPLLVPHIASDDCTIEGYDIPRDTMLLVNAWAIHRDPKLWDDATSFKPERFENGVSDAQKLIPFGMGRRACPGAGLAQRTLSLTLGSLIQCFEWERVTEKEVDMTEGPGVTMPRVVPLEAMCKARPLMHKVLSESLHDV